MFRFSEAGHDVEEESARGRAGVDGVSQALELTPTACATQGADPAWRDRHSRLAWLTFHPGC